MTNIFECLDRELEDKSTSDHLFKYKFNVFYGWSNILNIAGKKDIFNYYKSAEEADCNAIKSDWEMVGKDIDYTIKKECKYITKKNNQ